jgi:LAO/AO transport system kinase
MAEPVPALEDILRAQGGAGGKSPLARALAALEQQSETPEVIRLLDQAWQNPRAHVLGLTGPPGVGKSTLISALIKAWRQAGASVGVIAVDPSSRKSGGALLGDRTRLVTDPEDQGVFIRSMAARDRLGGLAALTTPAMVLMRAVYDIVLIETVGVGQSETDVTAVADTVIFCVQPGSGDSLQYMKAGIMEVPHVVAVTKADMGHLAERARADVEGALGLSSGTAGGWQVPVLLVSATEGLGLQELLAAADRHFTWLKGQGILQDQRRAQGKIWLAGVLREKFGAQGLKLAGGQVSLAESESPFTREAELVRRLKLAFFPPTSGNK